MAWDDLRRNSAAFRKGYLSALTEVQQDVIRVRSTNGTISDLEESIRRRVEAIFVTLSNVIPNSDREARAFRRDQERQRDEHQLKDEGIADGLRLAAAAARTRASGESGEVKNALLVFAAWCDQEAHRDEPDN